MFSLTQPMGNIQLAKKTKKNNVLICRNYFDDQRSCQTQIVTCMSRYSQWSHSPDQHILLSPVMTPISSSIETEGQRETEEKREKEMREGKALVEGRPPYAGYPVKPLHGLFLFSTRLGFTRWHQRGEYGYCACPYTCVFISLSSNISHVSIKFSRQHAAIVHLSVYKTVRVKMWFHSRERRLLRNQGRKDLHKQQFRGT